MITLLTASPVSLPHWAGGSSTAHAFSFWEFPTPPAFVAKASSSR